MSERAKTKVRREPVDRYVGWTAIKDAVLGQETKVLSELGIEWDSPRTHIPCPFPGCHGKPKWRWDKKSARAFCTCGSASVFECVMKCEGRDFEAAKVRVAEIIDREDLITFAPPTAAAEQLAPAQSSRGQRQDPISLLSPPNANRDDNIVATYLGSRLGLVAAEVPLPWTRYAGIKALGYYDPPSQKSGKPILVAHVPCAVFGMIDRTGTEHAMRIFLSTDGATKADLGVDRFGDSRVAKKLAANASGTNTSGLAAIWGDIAGADKVLLCEGIETGCALAHAFSAEIEGGLAAVAAAVSANGVEAFRPWDSNKEIIVCADRDEASTSANKQPSRRGEQAAEIFCERMDGLVILRIAMPGRPGEKVDWLDVYREHGAQFVHSAVSKAILYSKGEGGLAHEAPIKMPQGFSFGRAGLMYREDGLALLVAGPFNVIAHTRDQNGTSWGVICEWNDADGRVHREPIQRSTLATDGADVRKRLLDGGLVLGSDRKAREKLNEFLLNVEVANRAQVTDRIGWHGQVFVLPDQTFGATDEETWVLQTGASDHAFRTAGTLKDWQETIGRFANGNSRLMFALSAAFAAPLVSICEAEGGGIHFRGASSIGKSTVLNAAGSVWGGGYGSYVKSWRATSNGLEAVATQHNDVLLCLDELSQVVAKDAGECAYMLANGHGRVRANREGGARRSNRWTTSFLSSGELSLADKVAEDGRHRKLNAGQQVRVLDIPADAGRGIGLFEELHGFQTPALLAQHLNSSARAYYGVASRAFIAKLVESPSDYRNRALNFVEDFCQEMIDEASDPQVQRAARRIALIAAGGEFAAEFGIAPWKAGAPKEAAAIILNSFIEARGGVQSGESRAVVQTIRDFLSAHGLARFKPAWERDLPPIEPRDLAGYRKRVSDGEGWRYYLTPGAWREVFSGMDPRLAAADLERQGFLIPAKKGGRTVTKRIPDMGPVRVYAISGTILSQDKSD